MTEFTQALLISNVYRVLCLLTGLGVAYMGYRLFLARVTQMSGSGEVQAGGVGFHFRDMAPGSFFAICGVLIAFTGAMRPVSVQRGAGNSIGVTYPSLASYRSVSPIRATGTLGMEPQRMSDLRRKLRDNSPLSDSDRAELSSLLGTSVPSAAPESSYIRSDSAYMQKGDDKKWYEFWK